MNFVLYINSIDMAILGTEKYYIKNQHHTKYDEITKTIHGVIAGHKDSLEMWYYFSKFRI